MSDKETVKMSFKLGKDMLSVARKSVDHGELPKEGEDGWEKNSEGILVKSTGTGTVTMNIRKKDGTLVAQHKS